MSPLLIEIVMHYYCRSDDYRHGDFSPPALREAIDYLRDEAQLIRHREARPGLSTNLYEVTERGNVYIEAFKALPLPVAQIVTNWVMP